MVVNTTFIRTLLAVWVFALGACTQSKREKVIDEQYTLGYKDTHPFGASISHAVTEKVFSGQPLQSNRRPFDTWAKKAPLTSGLSDQHVYFIVSPEVIAWEKEADAMKQFIERGNTLVLVTDNFNDLLAEKFSLRILDDEPSLPLMGGPPMRDTWLQLHDSALFTNKRFHYFYLPHQRRLSASTQYQSVRVLALNESQRPAALRIRMGRGQLIAITNARGFSNYFLLSENNIQYLLGLYAYLPAYPASLTWDQFYYNNLQRQPEDYSVFSALLSIPPLRWAFWILLSLGLLWVLSNLRRKQRIIPVLSPNTNTTVSFVGTIAQLYYNKADHANMARKITAHFTDQLRSRYYLPNHIDWDDWAGILQYKTGLAAEDAIEMTRLMKKAQDDQERFTDKELLALHRLAAKAIPAHHLSPASQTTQG